MFNNPKLDLVNVDKHTKFTLILSIYFQDIEWKRNYDVNQVRKSVKILQNLTRNMLNSDEIIIYPAHKC